MLNLKINSIILEAVVEGLLNGNLSKFTKTDIVSELSKSSIEIEVDKLGNPSVVVALTFAHRSFVGQVTDRSTLAKALKTHPEQFLNPDGSVSILKVRKALKNFGKNFEDNGERTEYKSVFTVEEETDKSGKRYKIVKVSYREIEAFMQRISECGNCTIEDLINIGKDFDIIARALQEVSIDVTKDKTKDMKIDINDIISSGKFLSGIYKKEDYTDNLSDIIKLKAKGGEIPDYKLSVIPKDRHLLTNVDESNKESLKRAIVVDSYLGVYAHKGAEAAMSLVMDSYRYAATDKFKHITDKYAFSDNNIILASLNACRSAIEIINLMMSEPDTSSLQREEMAVRLRSALYTTMTSYGASPSEVVELALTAAFMRFKGVSPDPQVHSTVMGKTNWGSMTALSLIFPKELIALISGEIDLSLTVEESEYDLFEGDRLTFKDGYSITVDGCVVVKEDYTGEAFVTSEGLVADMDIYSFERTKSVFLDYVYSQEVSANNAPVLTGATFSEEEDKVAEELLLLESAIMNADIVRVAGGVVIGCNKHSNSHEVFAIGKIPKVYTKKTPEGGVEPMVANIQPTEVKLTKFGGIIFC